MAIPGDDTVPRLQGKFQGAFAVERWWAEKWSETAVAVSSPLPAEADTEPADALAVSPLAKAAPVADPLPTSKLLLLASQ